MRRSLITVARLLVIITALILVSSAFDFSGPKASPYVSALDEVAERSPVAKGCQYKECQNVGSGKSQCANSPIAQNCLVRRGGYLCGHQAC
jgi:hypothetical protein